jgi:hypothetical protein
VSRTLRSFSSATLAAFALVLAGCGGSNNGFAVDVTIVAASSLSDAQVASIHKLQVTGSDGFTGSVTELGRSFSSSRKERFVYKPRVGATSVTLTIDASTEAGELVTSGMATAALTAGKTASLTVTLGQSGVAGDMAAPDDGMAPSTDMASTDLALGPVVPSHVSSSTMIAGAADLTGVTAIDTTALTITLSGGSPGAAPANTQFIADSGCAVLSVGKLTVSMDIVVTGSRPLVIVAAKEIVLSARIIGAAVSITPGPGGSAVAAGMGVGGTGNAGTDQHPAGGGGAGFGTAGAAGGANPDGTVSGGGAGVAFNPTMDTFNGGSGGGSTVAGNQSFTPAKGGAGGGAVQLTSAISISVGAGGGINVGGGGGQGGPAAVWAAGGGGGSGGEIFLEAPAITVDGILAANGGGGGTSNTQFGAGVPDAIGVAGQDGQFGSTPALGGTPPASYGGMSGGNGGAGATAPIAGQKGFTGGTDTMEGGSGGGGAVGRIWLRTRNAAAVTTNGTISPPASLNGAL